MPEDTPLDISREDFVTAAGLTYDVMEAEALVDGNAATRGTKEPLYIGRGKNRRPFIHPGAGGYDPAPGPGFKTYHTAHGDVLELASTVKLADVLPAKNTSDVSLDRWLAATMLGDRCEDKSALDYVKDTKQVSGGTSGVLVPEWFQGEWIDNLRANMVLQAAGMQTATMTQRTVTASRVLTDPPVAWRAEGGVLAAGDPTFELRQLVAKSVAVRVQATAELAQDSPDFGAQLLQVMGRALAHEIDRVGLVGSGTGSEPAGIHNTTGIGTVTAVGTPANYSAFISGLQTLLEANVALERAETNAIQSPRTWATLENLQATDNQPLQRPRALERMTFRPTTGIPNNLGVGANESIVLLGDFSDLVLGVRLDASVEALRLQTFAENLLLEFVGWARVDFLVRRPASFVALEGVTA
jgi:HK97 family phage major capsid protein